jgi:hypothetical protein
MVKNWCNLVNIEESFGEGVVGWVGGWKRFFSKNYKKFEKH